MSDAPLSRGRWDWICDAALFWSFQMRRMKRLASCSSLSPSEFVNPGPEALDETPEMVREAESVLLHRPADYTGQNHGPFATPIVPAVTSADLHH